MYCTYGQWTTFQTEWHIQLSLPTLPLYVLSHATRVNHHMVPNGRARLICCMTWLGCCVELTCRPPHQDPLTFFYNLPQDPVCFLAPHPVFHGHPPDYLTASWDWRCKPQTLGQCWLLWFGCHVAAGGSIWSPEPYSVAPETWPEIHQETQV